MDIANSVKFSETIGSWKFPLVSIIIAHHNYSHMLSEALRSIEEQTYPNWECLVVDDCSSVDHREKAKNIVKDCDSHQIRFLSLKKNVGQIPAFFSGLDESNGEFICCLDPDDRYAATFLEEAVRAHLNQTVVCPILSTDQFTVSDSGITTACMMWHKLNIPTSDDASGDKFLIDDSKEYLIWIKPDEIGFHWSSTSAMMFRRPALDYLRPHKTLDYMGSADTYLGCGLHLLGGSLILTKPLIYRRIHDDNTFLTRDIFASLQNKQRSGFRNDAAECRRDSYEALLHNKAPGVTADQLYAMYNKPISRKIRWPKHSWLKFKRSYYKRKRKWAMRRGQTVHPFLPDNHVLDNDNPF